MTCCPNCGHTFNTETRRSAVTAKQRELMGFIRSFTAENNGVAPSFREMRDFMGGASISSIHGIVSALEERGHIERLPNKARSIVVIGEAA